MNFYKCKGLFVAIVRAACDKREVPRASKKRAENV